MSSVVSEYKVSLIVYEELIDSALFGRGLVSLW